MWGRAEEGDDQGAEGSDAGVLNNNGNIRGLELRGAGLCEGRRCHAEPDSPRNACKHFIWSSALLHPSSPSHSPLGSVHFHPVQFLKASIISV